MRMRSITTAALGIALAVPGGMMTATAYAAQPAQAYFQERPWDSPPDDYRDAQRQGFREGIEAARHDFESRSHKDADDHDRYKHPPVEREFRDQYREGFRHGYSEAKHHLKDMSNEEHDHY